MGRYGAASYWGKSILHYWSQNANVYFFKLVKRERQRAMGRLLNKMFVTDQAEVGHMCAACFFKHMPIKRPLFRLFSSTSRSNINYTVSIIQIEKSIGGVPGIRARGHRIVGIDETTELWRLPHVCPN